MFREKHLDALYDELSLEWKGKPEYGDLVRDAHLGIALFDAGRSLGNELSSVVVALIEKHSPEISHSAHFPGSALILA